MNKLIFIGDSLTEFFDWQGRFPDYIVQNLGMAGEPVEGLLERVRRLKFLESPDFLFVMAGINNLRRGDHDIIRSYEELLDCLAADVGGSLIVVQSILPVTLWVHTSTIEHINTALREMASARGMKYLDVYSLFMSAEGKPGRDCLEEDGVHVSRKGYEIWSSAVEKFLTSHK